MCQSIGCSSTVGFGPKTEKRRSRAAATRDGLTVGSAMLVSDGHGAAASAGPGASAIQPLSGAAGARAPAVSDQQDDRQQAGRDTVDEAPAAFGDHHAPVHASEP